MLQKLNFLGALQPVRPIFRGTKVRRAKGRRLAAPRIKMSREPAYEPLPRVCGRGQCVNHEDAKKQLKELFKKTHPEYAKYINNEKLCFGGVFVFDCTPFELIEKAANEESAELIRKMYEDAIELAPFVEGGE